MVLLSRRFAIITKTHNTHTPKARVEITRSKRRVREALEKRAAGVMSETSLPSKTITVYELPTGWRRPSSSWLKTRAFQTSTKQYPKTEDDVLAFTIEYIGMLVEHV